MAEMTDEQLADMDDEAFEETQSLMDESVESVDVVEEVVEPEPEQEEVQSEDGSEEEIIEETEDDSETEEVTETEDDNPADTETEEEEPEAESQENDTEASEEADTNEVDYKAEFEAFMKPVKVSGKEVQVKNVEDARNLIKMGIDYSRKMRDIKPLRSVGETLTQAGIMVDGVVNEAALTRLIDINNGDKNAIAQIMAEKSIDPLDMDTEDVVYEPQTQMVSEGSIELQDVEQELSRRGSVDNVISELDKLDSRSKQFFQETPSALLKLDNDIQNGSYEQIMGAVQYEKSLGRMTDMSDMDAYIHIASTTQQAPDVQEEVVTPKVNNAKRKAAGSSKTTPVKKKAQTYDYVNMSDEEFEKLMPKTSLY